MENLEQALSFAAYQGTLTKERKLLTQRFQEDTAMAYNGGLFKITPEFIGGIRALRSEWLLDMNGNPIKVDDLDSFITDAQIIYETALNKYGVEFNALRAKRNVKSLVNL
jgi:hypothetical protein